MRIVIYANCQGAGIRKILPLAYDFAGRVDIVNFENYKIISGEASFEDLVKAAVEADVFIYQPIGESQGKYSTVLGVNNIMSIVRQDALKISIPYIYNNGIWPFFPENPVQNAAPLDVFFEKGATVQDVIALYDAGSINFDIKGRIKRSLEILREREGTVDVKIAEYMQENMLDRELMFVQNHPSTEMFVVSVTHILSFILGKNQEINRTLINKLDSNYSGLPGRYPIDHYTFEESGIRYVSGPEEGAKYYYHGVIDLRHKEWISELKEHGS